MLDNPYTQKLTNKKLDEEPDDILIALLALLHELHQLNETLYKIGNKINR